jgi:hypothetical protein
MPISAGLIQAAVGAVVLGAGVTFASGLGSPSEKILERSTESYQPPTLCLVKLKSSATSRQVDTLTPLQIADSCE